MILNNMDYIEDLKFPRNEIVVWIASKKLMRSPLCEKYLLDAWSKGVYPRYEEYHDYINEINKTYRSELAKNIMDFLMTYREGSLCPDRGGIGEWTYKIPEDFPLDYAIYLMGSGDKVRLKKTKGVKYEVNIEDYYSMYSRSDDNCCIPSSYCKRKDDGWELNLEIKNLPFYRMMYFRRIEYPLMFHFYFDLNCKRTVAKFPIEYYIDLIKDVGEIIDAEWAFVANWNNGEILYKYNEAEVDRYLRLRKEEEEWSKENFAKRRAKLAQVVKKVLDDKKNGKPKQTYIIE